MYPVTLSSAYEPERSRLTTFFRWLTVIPVAIVLCLYALVGCFTVFAAWVMVSLTGRYPPGLYDFNAKLVRFNGRVNAYAYLLTDAYPPFNGEDDGAYPVQVAIGEPKAEYSRVKAFFRLIVGIPVLVLSWLFATLLGALATLAWVVILFTGRQPEGFQGLLASSLNYITRGHAYLFLLTEDYPPVVLEERALEQRPAAGGTLPS